jgi:hypothetical protein
MSKISKAVATALAALSVPEDELLASAERGDVVTIVTIAGQKLVYDPSNPPAEAPASAATPEGGAGASAPAPAEGAAKPDKPIKAGAK